MFDLNGNVPLAFTVKDAAGVLTNAAATTCTVTKPDGTPTVVTLANPSTGNYTGTGPSTLTGHYTVLYTSTTPTDSKTDSYDVRPASSLWLLSLAEAKQALNMTKTLNDVEVAFYLDMVTNLIEARVGPILNRSVTQVIHGYDTVALSYLPVVSVTTITADLTGGVALDPTGLFVDGTTGIIRRLDRGNFYNDTYTITYVAGRGTTVEPRFKMAAIHLLEHLWRGQRGTTNGPAGDDFSTTSPYSLPLNVLQDIETDLKVGGIA